GKQQIKIILANDHIEDEDLLEMVNADLIPMVIIDKHKGEFWGKIFSDITLQPNIKIHTGGKIGWAIRKNNTQLKEVINQFVKKNKKGTLTGNMSFNKYLKNTKYITNSLNGSEIEKFKKTIQLFKKYGKKYNFDHLMLAALAYQESQLDQSARSHVGAIGVMQIMPTTARDKNVNIPDIEKLEPNIHAGTKYLKFMANRYFGEASGIDPFNRAFFSFASYNAGPAKVARMRKKAKKMGLDPNVWFNNVEVVAAKVIGRETVQYVSNILKYYVAYKLLSEKITAQ
ncbi:MAG: transglycosylase SLT domain-containing protein, partial [Bacteroidetes bacterium]|nr:transglycosylase SLT domain-containing protein [Bacteroidota bacterium]